MADVAQLVRALVCGTRCREFESHLPPHIENKPLKVGAYSFHNLEKFNSKGNFVAIGEIFV